MLSINALGGITDAEIALCDAKLRNIDPRIYRSIERGAANEKKHYHAIFSKSCTHANISSTASNVKKVFQKLILEPRCGGEAEYENTIDVTQVKDEWFLGYILKEHITDAQINSHILTNYMSVPEMKRVRDVFINFRIANPDYKTKLARFKAANPSIVLGKSWGTQLIVYARKMKKQIKDTTTDQEWLYLVVRKMIEDPQVCFQFLPADLRADIASIRLIKVFEPGTNVDALFDDLCKRMFLPKKDPDTIKCCFNGKGHAPSELAAGVSNGYRKSHYSKRARLN